MGIKDFLPVREKTRWPITVEIIEDRAGGTHKTLFTRARRVYKQPANVSVYQIKDIKRDIIAPTFVHLESLEGGGELLRLYSPNPDDYFPIAFIKGKHIYVDENGTEKVVDAGNKGELLPVFDEESKAWTDWQIEKSHEEWRHKNTLMDALPFIMLLITALIYVAGIKFATDASIENLEIQKVIAEENAKTVVALDSFATKLQSFSNGETSTTLPELPKPPPL